MDRKLTIRERMRAKSRSIAISTILLVFLLAFPVVVANHAQIYREIGKVRNIITGIVNVTAFVIDTIMT